MATEIISEKPARIHIYEIDLIRAITVFSVVAIHSLSATAFLVTYPISSVQLLNLIIHALHYNREMFMFVTGLVLTFVYFKKPFSAKKFWLKRMLLVLIPYILWTLIYVKIDNFSSNFVQYAKLALINILNGNASYQLYYILLAVQFYLIFPLFLGFLKKVAHHPWLTLSISFFLQVIGMYLDFRYIQTGGIKIPFVTQFLVPYQDRIFLTYQFFFIFGAFAAIYINAATAFLRRYGRFLPILTIVTLTLYSLYLYHQFNITHEPIWYATSVLQPSVVIYSVIIIAFFCWLAIIWAKHKKLLNLVKLISDVSFGIYFVHVMLLTSVITYILPLLPRATPAPLTIIFTLIITFISSVGFCSILLKFPVLSWTIGRAKLIWRAKPENQYAKTL